MSNVATIDNQSSEVAAKPKSFGEQLAARKDAFKNSLPAHIPVERFMRVVMTAVQRNPKLLSADRDSLWTSSTQAANDGLIPDGREGALVIYNSKVKDPVSGRDVWIDKVQWMPMVAGIRKKVRNSNEIATWDAQVVHAADAFEYELGDDPFIRHKPSFAENPGPVIAAYSIATLKSGEKSREVMTRSQLEKVRAASKSKDRGPWVEWYEEMCRKTVARRHSKVLPMSTDLDDLIRRDDALYDLEGARTQANALSGGKPLSLAGKLDLLASPPTQEVVAPEVVVEPQGEQVSADIPATDEPTAEDGIDESEPLSPRDQVLDDLRAAVMDGKKLTPLLNGLGDKRGLITDDDVKSLRAVEKSMAQKEPA